MLRRKGNEQSLFQALRENELYLALRKMSLCRSFSVRSYFRFLWRHFHLFHDVISPNWRLACLIKYGSNYLLRFGEDSFCACLLLRFSWNAWGRWRDRKKIVNNRERVIDNNEVYAVVNSELSNCCMYSVFLFFIFLFFGACELHFRVSLWAAFSYGRSLRLFAVA